MYLSVVISNRSKKYRRNATNWFKHDTDATQDAKIKKLLIRHGAVGYAIYFHCLELIAAEISESNITFELEHDSEIIADNLHIGGTADKSGIDIVQEIMRYIINIGLFEESDGRIFCFKLLKRLDASMTSKPKFRTFIAEAHKNHDAVMTYHDPVMLDKIRTDKQEEIKEEKPCASPVSRIESARTAWNSTPGLPQYRYMAINIPPDKASPMLRTLSAYSDDEVVQSIKNYAKILSDPGYEVFPRYGSFQGFMSGGVELFHDDAKPFDRCRKKPEKQGYQKMGALDDRPDAWTADDIRKMQEDTDHGREPVDLLGYIADSPLAAAIRGIDNGDKSV